MLATSRVLRLLPDGSMVALVALLADAPVAQRLSARYPKEFVATSMEPSRTSPKTCHATVETVVIFKEAVTSAK